jgi:hypothetical protein
MRCPQCKERVREGATRCKHCHAAIGNNNPEGSNESIRYLQNGFAKISAECDAIEDKIKVTTGFIFVRHQHTDDELFQAVSRVESFAGKIGDDLEQWESNNQLSQRIRLIYNQQAESVYCRLERISAMIQEREPTLWEKVCSVFKRILEKLLPIFSFKFVSGAKGKKIIAGF